MIQFKFFIDQSVSCWQ